MMVRWFALGMVVTSFLLIALHALLREPSSQNGPELVVTPHAWRTHCHHASFVPPAPPPPPIPINTTANGVTVIDVAPGITPAALPTILHLAPGERVLSVDDRAVADDLTAGIVLAQHTARGAHAFIDLEVGADVQHDRRVLVLMH